MKKMIQDLAAGKSYELGPTSVCGLKVFCLNVIFIFLFCSTLSIPSCFSFDSQCIDLSFAWCFYYGDSELWPTEPSEFAEETLIYAIDSFFVVLWPLSHLVFKKKPGKVIP